MRRNARCLPCESGTRRALAVSLRRSCAHTIHLSHDFVLLVQAVQRQSRHALRLRPRLLPRLARQGRLRLGRALRAVVRVVASCIRCTATCLRDTSLARA